MISVSGKEWIQLQVDETKAAHVAQSWGTSWLVARLASTRVELCQMSNFLDPKLSRQIPDPMRMLGMEASVACLLEVLRKKQRICLFADYDVDGATSAAVLGRFLSALGAGYRIYVPDRITEGYGLSIAALKKIIPDSDCIITLDCGSASKEEIEYAISHKAKVIVLDHHAIAFAPSIETVVNPNRLDESGELSYLAAVGVTYLFVFAVARALKKASKLPEGFDLLELLDLVALGTVCDAVPLIGLNRAFIKQGLKIFKFRKNLGLKTLADICNLQGEVSTYHLGFVLGPRINAGSRVSAPDLGVRLLITNSQTEAAEIAFTLDACNTRRIQIEREMLGQAQSMAQSYASNSKLLLLGSADWHVGLIGIVASRIKDMYEKPTAIIAWQGSVGRGSCRSVVGFNFGSKLAAAKLLGIVDSGGGHAMAGGFSIQSGKIELLRSFLEAEAEKDQIKPGLVGYFDEFLSSEALTPKLLEDLKVVAPYGTGNRMPLFCLQGATLRHANSVGHHVCCTLEANGDRIKAFAFWQVGTALGSGLMANIGKRIALIISLQSSSWQGRERIECNIKDLIL